MDWTSFQFGAFVAVAAIFAAISLALYPVMRREFLLWLSLRAGALGVLVLAGIGATLPSVSSPDDLFLVSGLAANLSLAAAGPYLASLVEPRVQLRLTRKRLRTVFPAVLGFSGLLPVVIYLDHLRWLHDILLLGAIAFICYALVAAVRAGSRAAAFQAVAWAPAVAVTVVALGYELAYNAGFPYWLQSITLALAFEFIVVTVGIIDGFMGIKRERDRAVEDAREARRANAIDPLTGIANRRGLTARFNDSKRTRPYGLALVDCDHFKRVNDLHGHDVGDKVLVAVADALKSDGVYEARLGGEEFVVLLYEKDWQSQAETLRRRITELIREEVPEVRFPVTASAGLAAVNPDEELSSIMKRADRALYAAKDAGRNLSLSITEFRPPVPHLARVA